MAEPEGFDYVIVGAGSAGCVLANRLSEDERVTVCLFEAGPPDRSPLIHIPAGFIRMLFHPKYNWKFNSAPQLHMKGQAAYIPRGKTLGGSSSINGMAYVRGHRADYDEWADFGNPGWRYEDVLPYFRKSEHNENHTDPAVHGQGGLLNVRYPAKPNKLNSVFLAATDSMQIPRATDYNDGNADGYGLWQLTQKDGRRASTAAAFLVPAKARANLKVVTGQQVAKVIVDGGRAVGVEYLAGGETKRIDAKREVILSAGAIASPQILMLSGIGDGDELQKHGIAVVHAAPGIGKNLQDHVAAAVHFNSPRITSYGISIAALPKLAWSVAEYVATKKGFLASNIVESGGFYRTDPALERPDIQHFFVPSQQGKPGQLIAYGHGFRLSATLLHPKSRGFVGLSSADVTDAPVIDPKFFSNEDDLLTLIKGVKQARRILENPVFEPWRGEEVLPGTAVETDDEIADFIREFAVTVFHPAGTCKMGPKDDPMAVLDNRLRLRGVDGLRVVDAAMMPTLPSGNTNAPVIMIAEKAADMIREDNR